MNDILRTSLGRCAADARNTFSYFWLILLQANPGQVGPQVGIHRMYPYLGTYNPVAWPKVKAEYLHIIAIFGELPSCKSWLWLCVGATLHLPLQGVEKIRNTRR